MLLNLRSPLAHTTGTKRLLGITVFWLLNHCVNASTSNGAFRADNRHVSSSESNPLQAPRPLTVFHLQRDGRVESANREVEKRNGQSCLVSFVTLLVLHPNVSEPTRQRHFSELQQLFDSISLSNPKSCRYVLSDERTPFPEALVPGLQIVRNVKIPYDRIPGASEFGRYIYGACPILRLKPYADFLRNHAFGNTVFLDSDIFVVRNIEEVFYKVTFDLGITLTWTPSVKFQPNPKTVQCGVFLVHGTGLQRAAALFDRASVSCEQLPAIKLLDQLSVHKMILDGQAANAIKVNPNGEGYEGDGSCVRISFPPLVNSSKVVFFNKRFNCEATKASSWNYIWHFTGRRKYLMQEWHTVLMKRGLKGFMRFRNARGKDPNPNVLAIAGDRCRKL